MKESRKNILAISGSTSSKSSNESILQNISQIFSKKIALHIYTGIAKLPHFNADIQDEDIDASVTEFRERVASADGVIICTPEYVFSLPGSLKNAIEWTVSTTVFSHKPVALIVASASGEKAFEALKLIMKTIEADFSDDSTLLIRGAKGKINKGGEITDLQTLTDIKKTVNELINNIAVKTQTTL